MSRPVSRTDTRHPDLAFDIHSGGVPVAWLLAAVLSLVLHLGCVGWAIWEVRQDPTEDEAAGASMPIGLMTAVAVTSEEIAPRTGDPTPEISPQQATPPQQQTAPPPASEKTDIDLEQRSLEESAVTLPKPAPEQKEETKESAEPEPPAPPQPSMTAGAAAQQAVAPTPNIAVKAETASSIALGITPSARKSKATWQKTLVTHLDKFKQYPTAARATEAAGEALLEFTMDRAGKVLARRIVQGTGSAPLDAEVLEMLTRAEPLPAPPPDVTGGEFRLVVPVKFRLR